MAAGGRTTAHGRTDGAMSMDWIVGAKRKAADPLSELSGVELDQRIAECRRVLDKERKASDGIKMPWGSHRRGVFAGVYDFGKSAAAINAAVMLNKLEKLKKEERAVKKRRKRAQKDAPELMDPEEAWDNNAVFAESACLPGWARGQVRSSEEDLLEQAVSLATGTNPARPGAARKPEIKPSVPPTGTSLLRSIQGQERLRLLTGDRNSTSLFHTLPVKERGQLLTDPSRIRDLAAKVGAARAGSAPQPNLAAPLPGEYDQWAAQWRSGSGFRNKKKGSAAAGSTVRDSLGGPGKQGGPPAGGNEDTWGAEAEC